LLFSVACRSHPPFIHATEKSNSLLESGLNQRRKRNPKALFKLLDSFFFLSLFNRLFSPYLRDYKKNEKSRWGERPDWFN